jgi:DNA-binding PadR family transcriptional regulator
MGLAAVRVLQAIAGGAAYGFDIIDATGLPSGTVYPALSRHERDGYLKSSWEDLTRAHQDRRPPRRYYRITAEGRRALDVVLESLGSPAPRRARTARARS